MNFQVHQTQLERRYTMRWHDYFMLIGAILAVVALFIG